MAITSEQIASLAPLASPLSPMPNEDPYSPEQWSTLISICETYFPPLQAPISDSAWPEYNKSVVEINKFARENASPELLVKYLTESFNTIELREWLRRKLVLHIPKTMVGLMGVLLTALNTRAGSYLLTGSTTPLQQHSIDKRSKLVLGWSNSSLPSMRAFFRSMEILSKTAWLGQTKALHDLTGFPMLPTHLERNEGYNFSFETFDDTNEDNVIELEYDIVIVGSGCGAGVVASHLGRTTAQLKKKLRIAMLEKNYHFPSTHFPMNTNAASEHLMEGGGGIFSDDGSVTVLAGSTWGGGGTVNWSASLQPQHMVRNEWADRDGLEFFTTPEFQNCLDTVCEKMGVCKITDEEGKSLIPHNYGNQKLIEGSRCLGMSVETVPQNSASRAHQCGYCGEGCAGATKQGPANCWLPDAADHGVKFIEGCRVDEVLWDTDSGKKVRGIKAEWTSRDRKQKRKLRFLCNRVILSGGTLNSPIILLKSGIINPHVGVNLHLHPTMGIGMVWPERAEPWKGPILTAAMTSLDNFDGQGHGPKIELMAGTPGWMLTWCPWLPEISHKSLKKDKHARNPNAVFNSALDFKRQIAKYAYSTGFIAIQRDKHTGKVYLDPQDKSRRQIRIEYTISKADAAGLTEGVIAAAKIAYAVGAREIRPFNADITPFIRSPNAAVNDGAFKIWLEEVRSTGMRTEGSRIGSAHQMGTCRMSKNKDEGVVDCQGRVWGTQGLYVADASVFPSASGVNPMVTVMGIAEWISRGIASELRWEDRS